MRRFAATMSLALIACSAPASDKAIIVAGEAATAAAGQAIPTSKAPPPGMGVLCTAALLNVAVEIGRVCYPDDDPQGQQRLKDHLKVLDDYMLQDPGWTPERLLQFKRRQGASGFQEHQSCEQLDADTKGIYRNLVNADAAKLKSSIDELTAKPGKPSWGDCL